MHDNPTTRRGRSLPSLAALRPALCLALSLALSLLGGAVCASTGAGASGDAADGATDGTADGTADGLVADVVRAAASADPDAARLAARLERLVAGAAIDDSTSRAVRALLALIEERRVQLDGQIAAAAGAATAIAELEREAATADAASRAVRDAPLPSEAEARSADGPRVLLTAERDALDVALGRLRRELAALERRAPDVLRALETLRGRADADAVETVPLADGEGDAAATLLEEARRLERDKLAETLRGELGTIAPRSALAAARSRLLERRRADVDTRLGRLIARAETRRLEETAAEVTRLEDALAAIATVAGTAGDRARGRLERRLEHARATHDLLGKAATARQEENALTRQRRALLDAEASARSVLGSGSLTEAEGALLVRLRREMPSPTALGNVLAEVERAGERLRLRRAAWESELRRLETSATEGDDAVTLRRLVDTARRQGEALDRRTVLLADLHRRAGALDERLARRLLWLRRSEGFGANLLADVLAGGRWLTDPGAWSGAATALVSAVRERPLGATGGLLAALALLLLRRRLLAAQAALADRVGNVGRDGYAVTPQALLLVPPLALPLPLAIGAFGALLLSASGAAAPGGATGTLRSAADGTAAAIVPGGFGGALGAALVAMGVLLFALGTFRRLAGRDGIFVSHFAWSERAASDLHRHLGRLLRVQVPAMFLLTMVLASGRPELRNGLGLIAFVVASLALGAFVWRVCRPRTGVLALVRPRERVSPATRLLALVIVAVPVLVGLLPLAGYLEAAIALQERVFRSGLMLLAGAVLYGLLSRLYGVSLRRYSLRWARERRAARARGRDAALTGEAVPSIEADAQLAPEPLAGQARAALLAVAVAAVATGLWWLWAPLLPALGVIDEIVLWEGSAVVDGRVVAAPVTLWSVTLAIALAAGGIFAARNLRGLLQVSVLQRLRLDPGTRYAIVTIAGYVALGVGLVGGLAQLGIDWSKLQWIVAALGVGLGFGLQEIVANFVSGLIILFERPVRVGDTVTIGTLSGTVSDINIRATTITDFENREVLLPNKSIITENVTNWTLHDAITRLLLKIGVAYGSDVPAVRAILEDIVRAHPDVLAAPTPTVFFVGHGASSLDFELRVFVATPSQRLPVTHDLNAAINARLGAAGIGIPFPQTEVTLRGVEAAGSPTGAVRPTAPSAFGEGESGRRDAA